jgi:hypothetical protein
LTGFNAIKQVLKNIFGIQCSVAVIKVFTTLDSNRSLIKSLEEIPDVFFDVSNTALTLVIETPEISNAQTSPSYFLSVVPPKLSKSAIQEYVDIGREVWIARKEYFDQFCEVIDRARNCGFPLCVARQEQAKLN